MNNKIILATSAMGDTESLLNCINDIIANTEPMIIEANISADRRLSRSFPDPRSMEEAQDLAFYNMQRFERTCTKLHIRHAKRPQFDNYFIDDLIDDSRLTDLIVCSYNFLSANGSLYTLKDEVQRMLRRLECPLLVVPENAKSLMPIDVFAFDGTSSAMQAIKIFTYLFPQHCNRQALIYHPLISGDVIHEATSWFSAHYSNFTSIVEFPGNIQYNFICSSFNRPGVEANLIVSNTIPVFICPS